MIEKLPKITVITATFNLIKDGREAFFRQCVESVHNQTYSNIEHIVMDGASTDGTLDLIREYEEKGWLKCYSEPDECMVDAMNKGIQKSSGTYIAILNSDDYWNEEALSVSMEHILKQNADYSYGSANMLSRDGKFLGKWNADNSSIATFYYLMPFNHETMVCKKETYLKLGLYNYKEYGTASDYEFLIRLILNDYKGVCTNFDILNFRMDGTTNVSKRKYYFGATNHIQKVLSVYLDTWKKFLSENDMVFVKNMLDGQTQYLTEKEREYVLSKNFCVKFFTYIHKLDLKNFPYDKLVSFYIDCTKPFCEEKKSKKSSIIIFHNTYIRNKAKSKQL